MPTGAGACDPRAMAEDQGMVRGGLSRCRASRMTSRVLGRADWMRWPCHRPQLALEAWTELDTLSERERQVLRLAGEGLSSADIAAQLNLSHGTVRNCLSGAIGKLPRGL